MQATAGLGPLNDEHRRGFFIHSHYVVSEQGLQLGLLGADIMLRDDATFRTAATRKQRPIKEKESQRWVDGYHKASELARELPDCEVFSISDHEGDIFEVFQAWQRAEGGPRAEWIIRANQDRALVNVVEGEPSILFAAVQAAPVLGEIEFEFRAWKGTKKVKHETLGHRSVSPGSQNRVPGGAHSAQDRPGGDQGIDDLCRDRLANSLSNSSWAAVPGSAGWLRV